MYRLLAFSRSSHVIAIKADHFPFQYLKYEIGNAVNVESFKNDRAGSLYKMTFPFIIQIYPSNATLPL